MDGPKNSSRDGPLLEWLGVLLLFVGVGLAVFVLREIYDVYQAPESNQFIDYITGRLDGEDLVTMDEATTIGKGGATIAAFVILGFLASIGVTIALSFVRIGYDLSTHRIQSALAKLKEAYTKLSDSSRNGGV